MIIIKTAEELQRHLNKCRENKSAVGFVPTMGALHDGHLSLVKNSKSDAGLTACSIFVNPTQFDDPKDYEKYPSSLEEDIYKLETTGCDVLFLPPVSVIYPSDAHRQKHFELGRLEEILEGKYRPGHFQGVCMVVEKLLNMVGPDILYLGQKDYQQCMVIKKLIGLMGKTERIEMKISPTVREKDGLAMSSRNLRLNADERKKAVAIFEALSYIKKNIHDIPVSDLILSTTGRLQEKGFNVDYVSIADAKTLEPVEIYNPHKKTVALIAAYLNEVRLIDNMVIVD
jgi:pantoate--beta-alanine ligase